MNLSKRILTLLAIFCVIASAGIVCAADANGDVYDSTCLGSADDISVADQSEYDGGWAGSQYNATQENGHEGAPYIDPDYAHHEPAAGEPANATGNGTTTQAAQNTISSHSMLATGNPILLLLEVTRVLCGAAVLRRK